MSSAHQISANRANAQQSTGPRTEPGKATSSRNALTLGLFTMHDFVRPEEDAEYTQLCNAFWRDLNPQDALPHNLRPQLQRPISILPLTQRQRGPAFQLTHTLSLAFTKC